MRRLLLLAAVLLLGNAGNAWAQPIIAAPEGSPWPYQQWADEMLVASYPGEVVVSENIAECNIPDASGCAILSASPPRVVIGPPPGEGPAFRRMVLYHELGHVDDYFMLSDGARNEFMWINSLGGGWEEDPNPNAPLQVQHSAMEQFADAYAFCAYDKRPEFAYPGNHPFSVYWPPSTGYLTSWVPRHWQFVRSCRLMGRSQRTLVPGTRVSRR